MIGRNDPTRPHLDEATNVCSSAHVFIKGILSNPTVTVKDIPEITRECYKAALQLHGYWKAHAAGGSESALAAIAKDEA